MDLIYLVIGLALLEYFIFGALVGQARGKHGVEAPAVTGHPEFERRLRVQQNTLEQLMIFIPSLLLFGHYWSESGAAGLGAVFIVGRLIYSRGYVADPSKRSTGFAIGFLAQVILLLGAIGGAVMDLLG
jgi:glutathione S-transferase